MSKVVLAVERSKNDKTGLVSATYAPIQSCPGTCPFKDKGCYGQKSFCGYHLKKLNNAAREQGKEFALDIALEEARAIRSLKGKLPLRLHVVGDCKTPSAAKIVADACGDYIKKESQPVWTYTHAWRDIPRKNWGDISVLASCETLEEAHHAMKRGYAASIVRLKEFNRAFDFQGVRMTPCLEIAKGIKCDKCKLCFNDKKLLENKRVICFFPHGDGAAAVKDEIRRKEGFIK